MTKLMQKRHFIMTSLAVGIMAIGIFTFPPIEEVYAQADPNRIETPDSLVDLEIQVDDHEQRISILESWRSFVEPTIQGININFGQIQQQIQDLQLAIQTETNDRISQDNYLANLIDKNDMEIRANTGKIVQNEEKIDSFFDIFTELDLIKDTLYGDEFSNGLVSDHETLAREHEYDLRNVEDRLDGIEAYGPRLNLVESDVDQLFVDVFNTNERIRPIEDKVIQHDDSIVRLQDDLDQIPYLVGDIQCPENEFLQEITYNDPYLIAICEPIEAVVPDATLVGLDLGVLEEYTDPDTGETVIFSNIEKNWKAIVDTRTLINLSQEAMMEYSDQEDTKLQNQITGLQNPTTYVVSEDHTLLPTIEALSSIHASVSCSEADHVLLSGGYLINGEQYRPIQEDLILLSNYPSSDGKSWVVDAVNGNFGETFIITVHALCMDTTP